MCETVDAHLQWMQVERYARTTIRDRRKVLSHLDRQLPRGCCDVYADELEAFLATPTWARWTAHTYYGHLAGFYRWAYAEQWLSADPTAELAPPPSGICRPKPLTTDEISMVFQRSPEPWYGAAILAIGAGLRVSEIAVLHRRDVTPEYVHVRNGKGGRERFVDTAGCLWAYVAQLPPGPIVRRPYGRVVTGPYLSSQQRAHWLSIGLPQVHLHRLRHTFCTAMWQAGGDPLVIRDLMGHASVVTTQGYALPAATQRRRAVAAIDALLEDHRPVSTWPVAAIA